MNHGARSHQESVQPAAAVSHALQGGMAHDMSDSAMAAAMVRDLRWRFWAALLLTIPTVLFSSLGRVFFTSICPRPCPETG